MALWAYGEMGPSLANTALGIISAFVDNIPVMFAVLAVDPSMTKEQWYVAISTSATLVSSEDSAMCSSDSIRVLVRVWFRLVEP